MSFKVVTSLAAYTRDPGFGDGPVCPFGLIDVTGRGGRKAYYKQSALTHRRLR